MLVYYQMKNLIQCFTEILEYLLCFENAQLDIEKHANHGQQTECTKFIVKRQKYCNFCGHTQPQVTKVRFSLKCLNCCMQNSCLVLPASFMCNLCVDQKYQSVLESNKLSISQSKLENFNSQMPINKQFAGEIVKEALDLTIADWQKNPEFVKKETACLSKVRDSKMLY